MPSAKLLAMGVIAMVLIPALALVLTEVALRAAGVGHPTRYFVPAAANDDRQGGEVLETNHRFTHRFFPPALARGMIPARITRDKPPATYRIFLFGESAANGDPDPAYGFGRHLELLLESRFPDTDFEVICTAITAINSHVILPIAKECARIEADLWIVYMGNNEIIGPFGAGTVFGAQAPPLPVVRANIALKATRIGQLVEAALAAVRPGPHDLENWEGINMFAGNTLPFAATARARVLDSFSENLADILDCAARADVPVLLATVASNLRDCGPFASLHGRPLSKAEAAAWNTAVDAGRAHLARNEFRSALDALLTAARIDPHYAELQFLLAQAHAALGQAAEAKAAYTAARDFDALSVRADSRINDIIRAAAAARADHGVTLVDIEAALAAVAPDGIPGRESFFEHVHFTPNGNDQVARAFARQIETRLPEDVRSADTGAWASTAKVLTQLGLSVWDQHRLWSEMAERLATPPYSNRVQADQAVAFSQQQAARLQSRMNPQLDRKIYSMALAAHPDDYLLLTRFGYFLLSQSDFDGAIDAFSKVRDRFPNFDGGHQDLGLALLLAGRYPEAKACFQRVLELRPGYPRALKAINWIDSQPH